MMQITKTRKIDILHGWYVQCYSFRMYKINLFVGLQLRLDTGPGLYGLPVGLPVEIPVEILTCRSRLPAATGP